MHYHNVRQCGTTFGATTAIAVSVKVSPISDAALNFVWKVSLAPDDASTILQEVGNLREDFSGGHCPEGHRPDFQYEVADTTALPSGLA